MNLAEYRVEGDEAALAGGTRVRLTRETLKALKDEGDDRVILGFRPEAVEVVGDADKDHTTFPVTVTVVEELGSDAFLYGQYADATDPALRERTVIARVDPTAPPRQGRPRLPADRAGQGAALLGEHRPATAHLTAGREHRPRHGAGPIS